MTHNLEVDALARELLSAYESGRMVAIPLSSRPGFNLNTILAPPELCPSVDPVPPNTEFYVPARATGPGFYLIARGIETVDLIVRTNRPEFDQPAVAAFMAAMQETLHEAAGLPAS